MPHHNDLYHSVEKFYREDGTVLTHVVTVYNHIGGDAIVQKESSDLRTAIMNAYQYARWAMAMAVADAAAEAKPLSPTCATAPKRPAPMDMPAPPYSPNMPPLPSDPPPPPPSPRDEQVSAWWRDLKRLWS